MSPALVKYQGGLLCLVETIVLRMQYPYSEIVRSDPHYILPTSEQKQDLLINRAMKILRPFGVQEEDLENLVKQSIKRKHGL